MATYEYTTQDVEYLRHGDRRFMARVQAAGRRPVSRRCSNCMAAPGAMAI